MAPLNQEVASGLSAMAQRLRRVSVLSTTEAGSGHPTTCMSCAEIVSVLFFHAMRWDPAAPAARNADAFVLSKGHAAPILWAVLKEARAIAEDPMTLRRPDSPLEGHPTPLSPWVKVATGSLGQGLSAAAGLALSRRMDGLDSRIFCLLGDGECAEGSVWEAAQFAAHNQLENLVAIVDVNGLGQSDYTMDRHNIESFARRFEAFGWRSRTVDGHDVAAIAEALTAAGGGVPLVVVAKTQKGKGVKALEAKNGWHGKPLKKGEELDSALREIGDPKVTISVAPRRTQPAAAEPRSPAPFPDPAYAVGAEVATREAYGAALARLGSVHPGVVALDGDTKNSTFSEKFKAAHPARFVEAYIAEQNMVGVALGMASDGKIPFASTFAAFLTRAYDQIRMAVVSRPKTLVLCGSHSGVSIGEDGASQMGIEDLAMFRALIGSTVLYPSDAVSAEKLVAAAASATGIVYIRTTRPKTKVLYPAGEAFPIGGSKTLRSSAKDRATIVAAGVTVHEALEAHDQLKKDGIAVRVIDAYSVKPLDGPTMRRAAQETAGIITVEDHCVHGGLGDAVAREIAGIATPFVMLGVDRIPRSAPPKDCMRLQGITAADIAAAYRRLRID